MKYKIIVEEKVSYQHEIEINTEEDEDYIENILDEVDRDYPCITVDDVIHKLADNEIKIEELIEDNSGQDCETEIIDFYEVKNKD
ncbi:hypothetical protein CF067_17525 [Clostridium sporogenes]|uniref:Capsular exopolysaccharide family (Precursor) n=1 Tax=Clostridium botulinum B str. Osaka05 TaxID=1407017 RepID=A0A060N3X1_CLOBO|nr:hypothetical protein [Clostridium botulinum]BAO05236.1 capsular exopolysaccharide family (Precursor) [Clostridium botulinum B str. Osaka05]